MILELHRQGPDGVCTDPPESDEMPRFRLVAVSPSHTETAMRHAIALLVLLSVGAQAQEHRGHPSKDLLLNEKFYSTWHTPDDPSRSYCNMADCYPTEIRVVDGRIYARRREDAKWLPIPPQKVERNRDNPDGRNHLCAPPPTATSYRPDTVFCFSLCGAI
jgi:hypothetical protein